MGRFNEESSPEPGEFFYEHEIEKSHDRIEKRSCRAIAAKEIPASSKWEGLTSLVRVDRERTIGDKTTSERVYYICSLEPEEVELIVTASRKHWEIEGKLPWGLDVIFRQDDSRYRNRVGARNLSVLKKIAFNALTKTPMKGGMATKQVAVLCDVDYRDRVLKNLF